MIDLVNVRTQARVIVAWLADETLLARRARNPGARMDSLAKCMSLDIFENL